jgi:hypothetical protein
VEVESALGRAAPFASLFPISLPGGAGMTTVLAIEDDPAILRGLPTICASKAMT